MKLKQTAVKPSSVTKKTEDDQYSNKNVMDNYSVKSKIADKHEF